MLEFWLLIAFVLPVVLYEKSGRFKKTARFLIASSLLWLAVLMIIAAVRKFQP